MNIQLSVPTGKKEYNPSTQRVGPVFNNIEIAEDEFEKIPTNEHLKDASSISIFSEKADDVTQVEALAKWLNARIAFKGEMRKLTTSSGATLFQLVRRPSVSASRLFAALCEGKS